VNISDGSGPSDDELIIQVAVGGRFSPMKYSSYIIDLGSNHQTIASRIRPIKINILANDNEDSMIEKELRSLKGQ